MTATPPLALGAGLLMIAAALGDGPRARPPEFTPEDRAAFFADAFATLVGPRPEPAAPSADPAPTSDSPTNRAPAAAVLPSTGWADLISPDVLETEIKRQAAALAKATRSASGFKSGGYRDAADALGLLATAFAVTAEHPGDPRWRDAAAGLRDLLGGSAGRADAGTDAAHTLAAARSADLEDLVRGGRPASQANPGAVDWGRLATRSALMRRMEAAEQQRLRGWVASDRALRRSADDTRHEAQVLAALAEAIVRPTADDHDDPDYGAFAHRLRDAAAALARAAEADDHPAAAAAMTEVSRSCVDCHADYRG